MCACTYVCRFKPLCLWVHAFMYLWGLSFFIVVCVCERVYVCEPCVHTSHTHGFRTKYKTSLIHIRRVSQLDMLFM